MCIRDRFRRITMKVLTMQLNSVSVMDIVAYAGSAVGVVIAVFQAANGTITPVSYTHLDVYKRQSHS